MLDEKEVTQEEAAENTETIEDTTTESVEEEEVSKAPNEEATSDLVNKISELEALLEEKENRYLRLQADFDNYRRRAKLDFDAAQKYRAQGLVTDILPVLDNFERALKLESDNEQLKSYLQGMEMIYRTLLDALKKEGVEPIEAVGKEFDPHFHQAVMMVQEEGFDSNTVVEEFQKGYILKDRVIRPSMVKVNQ